jgi:hypothetical protein
MPNPTPVAVLDEQGRAPSLDEAAIELFRRLPPAKREQAAAIYERQGSQGILEYCASQPVEGTDDNFVFRTDPTAGRLAGLAHTHPGGHDERSFSPNDVAVATAVNKPSFIRGNESGEVRRFDPGVSQMQAKPGSRTRDGGTSRGTLIGNTRRDELTAAYDAQTGGQ